ncbi:MAG: hypothetical protein JWM11_102 [Planctomycetaceae bacterium]|nr:hypothetical protein [Planctomycetaceae bacterium]
MIRESMVVIAFAAAISIATYALLFIIHEVWALPNKWPPPIDAFYYPFVLGMAGGISYVVQKRRGKK